MMEQTIMDGISTVGFPIIAFFLMWKLYWRMTPILQENNNVLKQLKAVLINNHKK